MRGVFVQKSVVRRSLNYIDKTHHLILGLSSQVGS